MWTLDLDEVTGRSRDSSTGLSDLYYCIIIIVFLFSLFYIFAIITNGTHLYQAFQQLQ